MPFLGISEAPDDVALLSPSTLDVYTALAIVQGDCSSRDALLLRSRCSMPFFGVKPPPLLCSRRPHWTFIPLSPSCRAIGQVETRSYCAHGARTLLWQQATAAAVLSPSTLDVNTALAIVQGDYSSRDALAVQIRRLYRSRHRAGRWCESTHARCVALQLWPFVKLAQRSSYMTRICSADVDDMESDHLHDNLDSHDLDDSDYL